MNFLSTAYGINISIAKYCKQLHLEIKQYLPSEVTKIYYVLYYTYYVKKHIYVV